MDQAYDQYEEAMNNSAEEEKDTDNTSFTLEDMSVGVFNEHGDHIYTLAQHPISPNIILTGGGDDRVLVWDLNQEDKAKSTLFEIKEGFKDSIEYIKFNHDNKYMLITGRGNPIRVYLVHQDKEGEDMFEFKKEMETGDDINFINWHSKANLILTGGNDMMVWMFNALNGEFTTYVGHEDVVNYADFTPDGKLIVSISNDATTKVWNPRNAKWLIKISGEHYHHYPILSLWMINETVITGDVEGNVFIANIKTGESIGPIWKHEDSVECISSHSKTFVASGSLDGTIKILDIGKQEMTIDIPKLDNEAGITRLKCSSLNPIIYVAATNGIFYWIDIRNGEILKKYTAHTDSIMDFIVNEKDKQIITVGDDKLAYVFDM